MSEIEWERELEGEIGWHETNGRDMKEVRKRARNNVRKTRKHSAAGANN